MLADFKTIFRETRSLLWLWPLAWGFALFLVLVLEWMWGAGGAGLRERHTDFLSWVLAALVVAPLVENIGIVLIVRIGMAVGLESSGVSLLVGALSGVAHASFNNHPNGAFAAIFFFLMARIYVAYRHGPLGKSAFWFTVAMHSLNNALVVGVSRL